MMKPSLTLDHTRSMIEAAAKGLGIARFRLASVNLLLMPADWCPKIPGLYHYHAGHQHVRATLRAFIDTLSTSRMGLFGVCLALSNFWFRALTTPAWDDPLTQLRRSCALSLPNFRHSFIAALLRFQLVIFGHERRCGEDSERH